MRQESNGSETAAKHGSNGNETTVTPFTIFITGNLIPLSCLKAIGNIVDG